MGMPLVELLPGVADLAARVLHDTNVACKHFCLFKAAGSNFRNAHVHILTYGEYPGTVRPTGYDGLGHDDETPGMSNQKDPKHNSVSKAGSDAEFQPSPGDQERALAPIDLGADGPYQIYFHPCTEGTPCPEGYFQVQCKCGCACMTWSHDSFEKWHSQQK